MISTRGNERPRNDSGESMYWVNTRRPDILPESIDYWRDFHDWVETTDIEIVVSDAFAYISMCIAEVQYYLGGGFNYCFWFFTQEDKAKFVKYLDDNEIYYET